MTKSREPVTIENTLYEVYAQITIERAAAVTGYSKPHLRAFSDPDKEDANLSLRDAIKLDLEHRAAGGVGCPIYKTYGLLLDAACAERFADTAAIGAIAVDHAREHGEASAALIAASFPGASDEDFDRALRELEHDHSASGAAIRLLREQRARRTRDGPPRAPPD